MKNSFIDLLRACRLTRRVDWAKRSIEMGYEEGRVEMLAQPHQAKAVFDGWEKSELCILACLEGTMGQVYSARSGRSACAVLGDFAFLAGEQAPELIRCSLGSVSKFPEMQVGRLSRHLCVRKPRLSAAKPSVSFLDLTENPSQPAISSFRKHTWSGAKK